MKIYLPQTVLEAALERIRWLFGEFPNVIVGVSGGKDSTVVFHLALQVARELRRLPLRVVFVDQEAEWASTIEQVRLIMEHPDVEPRWYQMPIRLFNATSTTEHWLQCWDPAARDRWMREPVPYSVRENVYGTDRFAELFGAILRTEYPATPTCYIAGVRCEESPARTIGLTHAATYKSVTWGKILDRRRQHYTFYPIYDWGATDVWKAIHDHRWPYNRLYDTLYQYGVPLKDMRVSNVHHETAVWALFRLQEIEPETYVRLTQRLAGVDMAGKMGTADYFVRELPPMFASWREYRDYLLEKLIDNPEWRAGFRRVFDRQEAMYGDAAPPVPEQMHRVHVSAILTNDWEHIKLDNWERMPNVHWIRKRKKARLAAAATEEQPV